MTENFQLSIEDLCSVTEYLYCYFNVLNMVIDIQAPFDQIYFNSYI
jgi:hypothetical protein